MGINITIKKLKKKKIKKPRGRRMVGSIQVPGEGNGMGRESGHIITQP